MMKKIRQILTAGLTAGIFPVLAGTGGEKNGGAGEEKPAGGQGAAADGQTAGLPERIRALEAELAARQAEVMQRGAQIASLENALKEAKNQNGQMGESLKQAAAAYRTVLISANPEILPELIKGESPAELDGSLARARELTALVSSHLQARTQKTRIPAGAPARGPEERAGWSAREKIQQGLKS